MTPAFKIQFFRYSFYCAITVLTFLALIDVSEIIIFSISDKLLHAFAFLVLALIFDCGFPNTSYDHKKMIFLFSYGILIEILQHSVPYREASVYDLIANLVGITLYLPIYKWVRQTLSLTNSDL